MPKLPAYILSDTHLGVAPPDVERRLLRFLKFLPGRAGTLIINGDLFDFWFEWKSVIPRTGFRVIAALADLRDSGVEIIWVAGNHDCWGGEILREDVGVDYFTDAWEGNIGGWKVRIEHGDGLRDQEDRGYRMIRPVMRNQFAIKALRRLHPDTATRIAMGSSGASRSYRARDGGEGLRQIALAKLGADRAIDLLVYGHSHVAALERSPAGGIFGNAGSWLDAATYLVVSESVVELREADGSAEGNCLNSLDRST
ncbi:MAG: UDP-2,3-diacylglucosamine diphosphatase [Gemmatimonadaceae bacterium]|nr:UDP-2,3-diacylglucosamine diphosphatase [Gemmatimonadaceae bacterium]